MFFNLFSLLLEIQPSNCNVRCTVDCVYWAILSWFVKACKLQFNLLYLSRTFFFCYSLMVLLVIFEILKHTVLFLMSPLVILERLLEFPSVEEIIFTFSRVNYTCFSFGETKNFWHLRCWLRNLLTYLEWYSSNLVNLFYPRATVVIQIHLSQDSSNLSANLFPGPSIIYEK